MERGGGLVTAPAAAQKIIVACHHAQSGGQKVIGISGPDGLTGWTGMSESQVWRGLNYLRDYATRFGKDLVAFHRDVSGSRVYTVGDTTACKAWLVDRMNHLTTGLSRVEEVSTALANVTRTSKDRIAARQANRVVREADQLVADLLVP
jgi:hypothetical protein